MKKLNQSLETPDDYHRLNATAPETEPENGLLPLQKNSARRENSGYSN
ncbi:MAG: hypothetical protein ACR2N3_13450 [Pyrinomonadaceae bacterium]